jgi:thiol-disulfide isomerase/thioredoxin
MKRIILVALSLCCTAAFAQDGIQFSHASWKETLAKAKAENKLIFIDVYTSWCGPCKAMAKDVFPLKQVGDKFNASFINYKVDAEKGEGVEVAATYKVNAYPTYLFVNGDGVLYYTTLGAMPEADFLSAANNALTEFADVKPLPIWEAEYESKKTDKDFVWKYLQKRNKLRLRNNFLLDQYVSIASKDELMSKETLGFLLQQETATVDGPFFTFLNENKAEIEKALSFPAGAVEGMLVRYASGDLSTAVAKRDSSLMERIVSIVQAVPSGLPASWGADAVRMSYYTQTQNEKELIKVLDRYSQALTNYDKKKIEEENAQQLKNFEAAIAAGRMGNISPAEMEMSRKFYSTIGSTNYAFRVRALAEAAFKAVNDKRVLNNALQWMALAAAYSDNFTIPEVTAGVLYKMGKKEEAMTYQQKAIAALAAARLNNEVLSTRLTNNFTKMKENKPTWIASQAAVVNKK